MNASAPVSSRGDARDAAPLRRAAAMDIGLFLAALATLHVTTIGITERYGGPITALCMVALSTVLLRRRGIRWRDVGLCRPPRPRLLFAQVPLVTVTWLAVSVGVTQLVGQFLERPDTSARYGDLAGNLPATLWWIALAWVIGGFAEEMLFRGFLLRRLEALLARGTWGCVMAVVLQATLFGALHAYNRGLFGFLTIGVVGIVLGAFYVVFRRNLWPVILAHGLGNTLGFVVRYIAPG